MKQEVIPSVTPLSVSSHPPDEVESNQAMEHPWKQWNTLLCESVTASTRTCTWPWTPQISLRKNCSTFFRSIHAKCTDPQNEILLCAENFVFRYLCICSWVYNDRRDVLKSYSLLLLLVQTEFVQCVQIRNLRVVRLLKRMLPTLRRRPDFQISYQMFLSVSRIWFSCVLFCWKKKEHFMIEYLSKHLLRCCGLGL